jgi:hypothetical protein
MRLQRTSRRALLGIVTAAALTGSALVAPAGAATAPASASSDWLVTQLDSGLVSSEYHDGSTWQSYTDFGLTLDFYYAFDQLGTRAGQRQAILDAIEPRAAEYTDAWGTTYAGAMGKLLTAVQTQGIDPSTYGTGDLLTRLEGMVVESGPEQGRAKDVTAGDDSSNTFGQAFVATALTQASSTEAADAISFLLAQQCAAGYFRELMESSDHTCDGGTAEQSQPDVDATASTAIALQTLLADAPLSVREQARVALRDAVRWLVGVQRDSGAFVGNGRPNSNSTGLAAVALDEAGRDAAAAEAARWVNTLRVTPRLTRTSALRARDAGAVAYDVAAMKLAKSQGITRDVRYTWRRSTAQAAPALDALR